MAVRTISTSIKLEGEQEFKKQMSAVNSELKTLKSEMSLATAEFKGQANSMEALTTKGRLLQQQYDQQKAKVQALEQAVQDAAAAYGDADKRTDDYRRQLNYAKTALVNLNSEIQQNEKYLDEAKRSADQCATSIDEYGREVKQAAQNSSELSVSPFSGLDSAVSGLGSLKGALLGGAAAGAVVGGIQAVAGAITEVVDASAEYRKIMGTLEVSSQAAGYTAEQTAQTYKRLYSVLGDTQTAATTTANLQAIGLSQEQLMLITDSAIGAWARYGDSIPIDGLAEAINETIQAGQVTGTFADVLNWAGTSEDDFNAKLAAANSTTERANIVLQELTRQGLAEAGQAWIDTNDDIVAANESQRKFEEAQAELGEKLSPVRDFLRDLGTEGFEFLSGAIDDATQAIRDLGDWWDQTRPKLEKGWDKFFGIEEGSYYMMQEDGSYGWSKPDGSHAMGLNYVPWDGYIAMLHQGERVLTAEQARVMDSIWGGGTQQPSGVTTGDLQRVTASAINALGTLGNGGGTYKIVLQMNVNGKEFYRQTIDDLRAVDKERPEVLDDV
jgi:uncharacterized protein YoxC|uniref:Minor tail protein n=1 Tax=Myoviridae sp. cthmz15 TaxID=2826684 RepID=A0A8S5MHB0_9CAUD|nr:MAG TPA: minor tail protein [Myoviridae sp. cthmz15]